MVITIWISNTASYKTKKIEGQVLKRQLYYHVDGIIVNNSLEAEATNMSTRDDHIKETWYINTVRH